MKADAVIIGAGIAGSALAYHLSDEGLKVALVDKDYPGLGTSGRSAGFLTVQHWNRLDLLLSRLSQEFCSDILQEKGGLQRVGFLRVTARGEDIPLMKERTRMYRQEGVEAELLEGKELEFRFPAIDFSGLAAGIHTPGDGFVDAYDVTTTLASLARANGTVMKMATTAQRIEIRSSKVSGVETAQGKLSADIVAVAAGAWSGSLLRKAEISLPLKPYRTQALVTAPVEGLPLLPMFHELPDGYYFRPDQDGILLGDGTEYREAEPTRYNTHADFGLYSEIAGWISKRMPTMKEVVLARGWAGLCVATPDRYPLVGPLDAVDGLYLMAGFNGLGVMRSPPLARALADKILGRRPSVNLAPLRPGRFSGNVDFPIMEGFTLQDTLGLSKSEPSMERDLE